MNNKTHITVRIDNDIYRLLVDYCIANNVKLSTAINNLLLTSFLKEAVKK